MPASPQRLRDLMPPPLGTFASLRATPPLQPSVSPCVVACSTAVRRPGDVLARADSARRGALTPPPAAFDDRVPPPPSPAAAARGTAVGRELFG
jgi:hypothetical protein